MRTLQPFQSIEGQSKTKGAVNLQIEGMNCTACAARVEKAIRELPGIASVEIDLPAGKAKVEHDPNKVSVERIIQQTTAAGYKAVPA